MLKLNNNLCRRILIASTRRKRKGVLKIKILKAIISSFDQEEDPNGMELARRISQNTFSRKLGRRGKGYPVSHIYGLLS
jgi:hypothetical protein